MQRETKKTKRRTPLTEKQRQTVMKARVDWHKNLIERGARTQRDALKNIDTLEDEHLDLWFDDDGTHVKIEFLDACVQAGRAPTAKMNDWASEPSTLRRLKSWLISKRYGDFYPQMLARIIIAYADLATVTDSLLHTAVSAQNKSVVEQLLADPRINGDNPRVLARARKIENGQEIVDMLLAWTPTDPSPAYTE